MLRTAGPSRGTSRRRPAAVTGRVRPLAHSSTLAFAFLAALAGCGPGQIAPPANLDPPTPVTPTDQDDPGPPVVPIRPTDRAPERPSERADAAVARLAVAIAPSLAVTLEVAAPVTFARAGAAPTAMFTPAAWLGISLLR